MALIKRNRKQSLKWVCELWRCGLTRGESTEIECIVDGGRNEAEEVEQCSSRKNDFILVRSSERGRRTVEEWVKSELLSLAHISFHNSGLCALRSTRQYKPHTENHKTCCPSCKSITSLLFKVGTWILALLHIYFSWLRFRCCGTEKKYDECLLARGGWVVCICHHCYYSRQQSYRPISRTIITVISGRSHYNSSQLSTSQSWQPRKHAPAEPCT